MEDDIVEAHRDRFYFEKVEAENAYNQEAGISERMNFPYEFAITTAFSFCTLSSAPQERIMSEISR